MINFIDYSTNYMRVFCTKNKVEATKKFKHFLSSCAENGWQQRVRQRGSVLQATGVRRQISERENQATNGKVERMHRTILNVASLLVGYRYTSGETQSSMLRSKHEADITVEDVKMLTGSEQSLSDVVTFGSPCTAYHDPGKKSWRLRAKVGMIVGINDETKGFKVYLPKARIVITTQHIRNVETFDRKQNSQLQEQLECEDPDLKQAVEDREQATKRKEASTTGGVTIASTAKAFTEKTKSKRKR
ncbi:Copia LTR rider [Phytophthora megakarya]|uniref:Copia LTR rider n=1 Tax=Phytophthora megakarya TaxID=4795 RepID=A0A225W232_9STRA|nr:Copia LTR rider [Phytophthora megakarya]